MLRKYSNLLTLSLALSLPIVSAHGIHIDPDYPKPDEDYPSTSTTAWIEKSISSARLVTDYATNGTLTSGSATYSTLIGEFPLHQIDPLALAGNDMDEFDNGPWPSCSAAVQSYILFLNTSIKEVEALQSISKKLPYTAYQLCYISEQFAELIGATSGDTEGIASKLKAKCSDSKNTMQEAEKLLDKAAEGATAAYAPACDEDDSGDL